MTPYTAPFERRLLATRVIFVIIGLGMALWAPLVPVVQENLGLSKGDLGLLILAMGGGVLLAMPLAGALAAKLGLRRAMIIPAVIAFAAFPVLLSTSSVPVAAVALAIFGAGISIADVAMNMQAVIIEEEGKTPRMSSFHGMWSVGGILGALTVSALLWLGTTPLMAALAVIAAAFLGLFLIRDGLIARSADDDDKPLFVVPKGLVIWIGVLCALAMLPEFSVLDWSAVFLREQIGVSVATAGLGYAVFSIGMVGFRIGGDRLRKAFGDPIVFLSSAVFGAGGLALVAASGSLWLALVGYLIMGAGIANLVPILFSIAGRSKDMPAHLALPAVVLVAQLGALGGPAGIGLIAEQTSLRFAFLLLAGAVLVIGASYRVAKQDAG